MCPAAQPSLKASPQTEELFDLIASSQSRRLDDQRASVGSLPGLRITHNNLGHLRGDGDLQEPGDEFFNMLIKCQVGLQPGKRGLARPWPRAAPHRPALGVGLGGAGTGQLGQCHRVSVGAQTWGPPPGPPRPSRMFSGRPPFPMLGPQGLGLRCSSSRDTCVGKKRGPGAAPGAAGGGLAIPTGTVKPAGRAELQARLWGQETFSAMAGEGAASQPLCRKLERFQL